MVYTEISKDYAIELLVIFRRQNKQKSVEMAYLYNFQLI